MTTTPEAFLEKKALADAKSHVDYALQAGLGPDTRYVRELADLGAVSFEIFLADLAPPMLVDRSADLLACLAAVRAAGGVVGITPGDDSIVQTLSAEAQAKYPTDRLAFARARPPIAEAIGIARACLAVAETCCRAHVRQVSCALGVAVIEALAPSMLSSEVTIHNLLLEEQEIERLGPIQKVVPPLRPRSDLAALLAALRGGTIKIVATDHAPHLPEEKQAGNIDIWKAPGGFPGVQTLLPLMLGLAGDGAISLPDLVRVCCELPARLFGLHPRKGTLAVGADADIVVVDPRRPFTVRNQDQESKAKLTPFDGWTVPMTPVAAFLRGRIVMRDGRPVGAPSGRFLAPALTISAWRARFRAEPRSPRGSRSRERYPPPPCPRRCRGCGRRCSE